MIKNFLLILCGAILLFLTACKDKDDITTLSENVVYLFYQDGCPHCEKASDFISENYAELPLKKLNIAMPGNKRLFDAAARSYRLGTMVGTPLICMGKNHIMGWGENSAAEFDMYAEKYL